MTTPIQTTLFALLDKADLVEIDGYEVEEIAYPDDKSVRLEFCGGDDTANFVDQPVEFSDGACQAVTCDDDLLYDLIFKVTTLMTPEDLV